MAAVVFNNTYGGFWVPQDLRELYAKKKGVPVEKLPKYYWNIPRHDPDFVAAVREQKAKGICLPSLSIISIGDAKRYWIEEYDGKETVHTDSSNENWVYIEPESNE